MMARRLAAATCAIALSVVHVLAIAHLASVRHHWCPEHQTEEDAHAAPATPGIAADIHDHVTPAPAPADRAEHEACRVCAASLTAAGFGTPRPHARTIVAATAPSDHATAAPTATRPLFWIAPKTSPPVA